MDMPKRTIVAKVVEHPKISLDRSSADIAGYASILVISEALASN